MRVWHVVSKHKEVPIIRSRAFANPNTTYEKIVMYFKGWRRFNDMWWSKPNKSLIKSWKESGVYGMVCGGYCHFR